MSYVVYYPIEGDTLPHLFDTFDGGNGSSITMSGLAVTDIEIYKDGGTTQRASDSGYTLLDTDGIDFDGITGIHGFSIDLSDDTDTGFFAVGPWYHVVVSAITVDAQTVNFIACAFRILDATRGMAGTALPDAAADAAGGLPISDAGGLDLDTMDGNVTAILADTNELQTDDTPGTLATIEGKIDTIDGNVDSILVDTGTTLQAELDGIQADTEDIQSRLPAALVNSRMDATIDATGFEDAAVDKVWDEARSGHTTKGSFGEGFNTLVSGTVSTAVVTPSTTEFGADDITEATADHFIGRIIIWITGALVGQATDITDYALNTGEGHFTVAAMTEAPGNNDRFVIL